MKVCEMLDFVKKELEKVGIFDDAEAEWLVALALDIKRSAVFSNQELSCGQEKKVLKYLERRKKHEPLAYIHGTAEFFGIELEVNNNVLIPRPETEELVLKAIRDTNSSDEILDLCTGSGAIAIAVKKNTGATVVASDISKKAIEIASKNAKNNNLDIEFVCSNLFKNLQDRVFDKILSNPPYISEEEFEVLETDVKDFEPKLALVAKNNGLEIYEKIIGEAPKFLKSKGKIYFEIGHKQADEVCKMLEKDFEDILVFKDLEGKDRIVVAQIKS